MGLKQLSDKQIVIDNTAAFALSILSAVLMFGIAGWVILTTDALRGNYFLIIFAGLFTLFGLQNMFFSRWAKMYLDKEAGKAKTSVLYHLSFRDNEFDLKLVKKIIVRQSWIKRITIRTDLLFNLADGRTIAYNDISANDRGGQVTRGNRTMSFDTVVSFASKIALFLGVPLEAKGPAGYTTADMEKEVESEQNEIDAGAFEMPLN